MLIEVVYLTTPNDIDITLMYEVEQSADNTRGDPSKTRIRFRPAGSDEKDAVCVELDRSAAPRFTKDPTSSIDEDIRLIVERPLRSRKAKVVSLGGAS
jgi:hypothetical protein